MQRRDFKHYRMYISPKHLLPIIMMVDCIYMSPKYTGLARYGM
jgi:hypothetical protein